MHLLGFFSLACSLLAAALLPGPREAPAAAAFESGLGFSDAEPDGGEVKVRAPRVPVWGRTGAQVRLPAQFAKNLRTRAKCVPL